jgi:hypothetical protein
MADNIRIGATAYDNLAAAERKLDVRDFIFNLEPDEAPFTTLLGKLRKEVTQDTAFSWFEDASIGKWTQVDAQANGAEEAAQEIHVDDADIFQIGDVVKVVNGNAAGECWLVTDVDASDDHIHVVRAYGSTTAGGHLATGDYLVRLGQSKAEGYTVGNQLITAKTQKTNYVQIFSRPVQFTEIANAVSTYGGNRRNYERKKVAIDMKRDIEAQFLFGEPKVYASGPSYATGGVKYFMGSTSPSLNCAGALHKDDFDGFLRDAFAYGSSEKFLFVSGLALSYINGWADSYVYTDPGAIKEWGVTFTRYRSPFGIVNLVFNKNLSGPYAGECLLVDMKELVYRYLVGMDLKLLTDLQPKNVKYLLDEWTGTIGLEMHNALSHARIYGIS